MAGRVGLDQGSGEIVDAIAHVLQVKTGADKSPADSLKRYLADKHLLLVLDNFEHLLEAAPWVGEAASRCASDDRTGDQP